MIDKAQPICYAVLPMCFLLLISLSDSTVATKENLHLKKKLTTMSVTMKINLYLHVTGI